MSLASLTLSNSPTFDFGAVSVSAPADKTFTVTNSGAAVATAMAGAGLVAPFQFKGGNSPAQELVVRHLPPARHVLLSFASLLLPIVLCYKRNSFS